MRKPLGEAAALAAVVCLVAAPAITAVTAAGAAAPPLESDGAPTSADAAQRGGLDADALLQTGEVDPDGVTLRAEVEPDGDAAWTITYRIRLADENETAAFESLRADVGANTSSYVGRFARRMNDTVAAAENATDREMSAEEFSVSTRIQESGIGAANAVGFVAYSFQWSGFAAVEGDRVVAGDAIAGLFLDRDAALIVAWPENYERQSIAPTPPDVERDRAVGWEGERTFGADQPQVVVAPQSALPVSPIVLLAVAAVLVVAIGGGLWLRGDDVSPDPDVETDPDGDPLEESAPTSGGALDGAADDPADDGDGPPEELLSPEERVLRLLEREGGRMKQKDVTEAMDWSAARTSQVVGELRDDGTVETFRLGRENVLRLPEDDDPLGPDGDDDPE